MFTIKFNGKSVPLPEYYVPISLESFLKKFKNDSSYVDTYWEIEGKYKNLKDSPFDFQFFIDKHIKQNSILVVEGEYIDLNKDLAGIYSGMLEKQMIKEATEKGLENDIIENRFFSNTRKKIIKIKMRSRSEFGDSFLTQYIITENNRTYMINVSSLTRDDFEELIKSYW